MERKGIADQFIEIKIKIIRYGFNNDECVPIAICFNKLKEG